MARSFNFNAGDDVLARDTAGRHVMIHVTAETGEMIEGTVFGGPPAPYRDGEEAAFPAGGATPVTWWVTCDEHDAGPYRTRGRAEAALAGVTGLGQCQLPHEVTSSVATPRLDGYWDELEEREATEEMEAREQEQEDQALPR
jgi:hypothetical protein